MIKGLYALKDTKAGAFASPFTEDSDGTAARAVAAAMARENNNLFSQYPEDFELWCVGTVNLENGNLVGDVRFICQLTALAPTKGA